MRSKGCSGISGAWMCLMCAGEGEEGWQRCWSRGTKHTPHTSMADGAQSRCNCVCWLAGQVQGVRLRHLRHSNSAVLTASVARPPVQADLWSVGAILFELLAGRPPYSGANHVQLLRNIERSEARLPDAVAARLSPQCLSLITHLLQRNPVERLTFDDFFRHPFLAGAASPCRGVVPPARPSGPMPQGAALPAAVRQAAAAAAAAAAVDAPHRLGGVTAAYAMPLVQGGGASHPPGGAPPVP